MFILGYRTGLARHGIIRFPQVHGLGHPAALLTVDSVVVGASGACKIGRVHGALCVVLETEVAEALRGCS